VPGTKKNRYKSRTYLGISLNGGVKMAKKELLQKLGDMSQYAGFQHVEYRSGRGKGSEAFEAYNAGGLQFSVMPDKCMDIFQLIYKGVNIGYISKNGLVAGSRYDSSDDGFLKYWSAGMLSTCGLDNVGPACVDQGVHHGIHGRLSMLPAENICTNAQWIDDDYELRFSGEMRQSMLDGMNLRLKRQISTGLYDKEIVIQDTLENLEPVPEEFMILYHFNFGYPLLDNGARIVKPKGKITPRDDEAKKGISDCLSIQNPRAGKAEQVYFHENKTDENGMAYVGLINDKLKLGAYLKYRADTLPVLVQWKSYRPHDYALGLEPSNSYIMGRGLERENGTLKSIDPYETLRYKVVLGILDGEDMIRDFEDITSRL